MSGIQPWEFGPGTGRRAPLGNATIDRRDGDADPNAAGAPDVAEDPARDLSRVSAYLDQLLAAGRGRGGGKTQLFGYGGNPLSTYQSRPSSAIDNSRPSSGPSTSSASRQHLLEDLRHMQDIRHALGGVLPERLLDKWERMLNALQRINNARMPNPDEDPSGPPIVYEHPFRPWQSVTLGVRLPETYERQDPPSGSDGSMFASIEQQRQRDALRVRFLQAVNPSPDSDDSSGGSTEVRTQPWMWGPDDPFDSET